MHTIPADPVGTWAGGSTSGGWRRQSSKWPYSGIWAVKMVSLREAATFGTVMCATMVLLAGCVTAGSSSAPPDVSSRPSAPILPSPPSTEPTVDATDGCGSTNVSVDYAPYMTTSTLASYGWGFVVATVTSVEPAIFNTTDGARPMGSSGSNGKIFTPIDVQVDRVMSGPMKAGSGQILIEGGTVGCYTTRVDMSPIVKKGGRYVFIVTDAQDPTGKSLRSLQEAKFAWPVDASGSVVTIDGPTSVDSLAKLVAQTPVAPKP